MNTKVTVLGLVLVQACGGGGDGATDPGHGQLVAALPENPTPLAMFGDDSILHVVTGDTSSGRAAISFVRVDPRSGSLRNETLPSNIDWSDFGKSSHIPFLGSEIADGTADAAFVMGFRGVTEVPFDGSPSALLARPAGFGPNRTYVPFGTLEGFHPEPDGTTVALYCVSERLVCGSLSATGTWTEIAKLDDECWPSRVLTDADAVYFGSMYSLWRVDRNSHEARLLYYVPQNGGTLSRIAQTSDAIVMVLPTFADGALSAFEIAKVPKRGGALVSLRKLDGNSPFDTGMVADDRSIYYLTQIELDRISLTTGSVDVLAKRGVPGAFMYPVLGSSRIFFLDVDEDSGNTLKAAVRSVAK